MRTPPLIDPAANPAERTATKTPRARFRSLPSGKSATKIDRAVTEEIAAPIPWTALEMTNARRDGAKPPTSEATVKRTTPKTNNFFWP